jgi:hypothetical protein
MHQELGNLTEKENRAGSPGSQGVGWMCLHSARRVLTSPVGSGFTTRMLSLLIFRVSTNTKAQESGGDMHAVGQFI